MLLLEAICRGDIDATVSERIAAAKSLIAYQHAKVRAVVASPTPTAMRKIAERVVEDQMQADFDARAAAIRKRFADLADEEKGSLQ